MNRDIAADPDDVAVSAILDCEILIGDASGERHRLDAPQPNIKLGHARRRALTRRIEVHACGPPGWAARESTEIVIASMAGGSASLKRHPTKESPPADNTEV